jgi:hypothetical protein
MDMGTPEEDVKRIELYACSHRLRHPRIAEQCKIKKQMYVLHWQPSYWSINASEAHTTRRPTKKIPGITQTKKTNNIRQIEK